MQNLGDDISGMPRYADLHFSGEEIDHIVLAQLEKLPEIRVELVRFLRQAISENRYSVPEERVAERMIHRCLTSGMN